MAGRCAALCRGMRYPDGGGPTAIERAPELLVGGVQELGVADLGEALALILARGTAAVDAVDQPGPAIYPSMLIAV